MYHESQAEQEEQEHEGGIWNRLGRWTHKLTGAGEEDEEEEERSQPAEAPAAHKTPRRDAFRIASAREGSITVMPPFLKVSASVASWLRISWSCQAVAASMALLMTARSASEILFQAASLMMTRRGVMMWPVSTRYFCTSKSLPDWMVGSGFSSPSMAPCDRAR